MKEKIYTIPLMDAFKAEDECPFCFIERNLEQHAMDFVLGSGASYMEDDVRAETDEMGFCRTHYKKMFDYGNRLGCGLILTTHFKKKNQEFKEQLKMFSPGKASMLGHFKKAKIDTDNPKPPLEPGSKNRKNPAISATTIKIPITVIWILSLNFTEKIRNLKSFLKTAKVSASPISQIL